MVHSHSKRLGCKITYRVTCNFFTLAFPPPALSVLAEKLRGYDSFAAPFGQIVSRLRRKKKGQMLADKRPNEELARAHVERPQVDKQVYVGPQMAEHEVGELYHVLSS